MHSSSCALVTSKEDIREMLDSTNINDKDFGLRILKFLESFGEGVI